MYDGCPCRLLPVGGVVHAVLTERAVQAHRIDDEVKGPEVSASTVQKISTGAVRSDVAHIRLELHRHILV